MPDTGCHVTEHSCEKESVTVRGNVVSTNGRVVRAFAEWFLFVALAVASTYPLLAHAGTHLPQATNRSATVPLLNLWTLWWNVDRIDHAYQDYWNAPIYHGVSGVFAGSEPQTVVGFLAWPLWKTLPTLAHVYNLLIIVALTLNGWFTCQLLRRLRLAGPIALCGGAMVTLLPLVHWQLGVFQLVPLWGILWTLLALLQFQRHAGLRQTLQLGVAFAVTYSLCCYYGLFLSLLLLACGPLLLGRELRRGRTWIGGVAAVAVAVVLLAPILIAQLNFARQHSVTYPTQWFLKLSATPADYLRTPGPQLVTLPDAHLDHTYYHWPLSPGTLKLGMACIGMGLGLRTRRRRRVSLMLGGMVTIAIVLSMGPRLQWHGYSIYRLLADYYPGFGHARNLFRFAFFAQIGIALLAAIGLHELYVRLHHHGLAGRRPRILLAAVSLLGLLLAFEAWPRPPAMYALPAASATTPWIAWLRARPQAGVCLACFPRAENNREASLQPTAEWMYFQTYHARPMINGYSTVMPWTFRKLNETLKSFPNQQGVLALRDAGVTHVLFDRRERPAPGGASLEALEMTQVIDDAAANIEIWSLPE